MLVEITLNDNEDSGLFKCGTITDNGSVYALHIIDNKQVGDRFHGFMAFASELMPQTVESKTIEERFPFFSWTMENGTFCILPSALPIATVVLHNKSSKDLEIEDVSGSSINSFGVMKAGETKQIHPAYTNHFFKYSGLIEDKSKVSYELWLSGGITTGYFNRGIRREGPREERVYSATEEYGVLDRCGAILATKDFLRGKSISLVEGKVPLMWGCPAPWTITFFPTGEHISDITIHNDCPHTITLFDASGDSKKPAIRLGTIHPGKTKKIKLNHILSCKESANIMYEAATGHTLDGVSWLKPNANEKLAVKNTSSFRISSPKK